MDVETEELDVWVWRFFDSSPVGIFVIDFLYPFLPRLPEDPHTSKIRHYIRRSYQFSPKRWFFRNSNTYLFYRAVFSFLTMVFFVFLVMNSFSNQHNQVCISYLSFNIYVHLIFMYYFSFQLWNDLELLLYLFICGCFLLLGMICPLII